MKDAEIVKDIMKTKGVRPCDVAGILGLSLQTMNDRINKPRANGLTTATLNDLLRALGYKAVIMPREQRMQDGWYKLED